MTINKLELKTLSDIVNQPHKKMELRNSAKLWAESTKQECCKEFIKKFFEVK